ncbi:DnaJ like protein subfamily C member 14, partial [Dictyocoela muelleri]
MNNNKKKTQEIQKTIDEIWDGYNSPTQPDLSVILGVTDLKDNKEVREKYLQRSLLIHPDKTRVQYRNINFHDEPIDFFFKILNQSYKIASDPQLNAEFQNQLVNSNSKNERINLFKINLLSDSNLSDRPSSNEFSESEYESSEIENKKHKDQ